jgi:mannose-6-phosphate isomerase class I
VLGKSPYFHVEKHTVKGAISLATTNESFHALTCVCGSGMIEGQPFAAGDTFFVPATRGAYTITGNAELILTKV